MITTQEDTQVKMIKCLKGIEKDLKNLADYRMTDSVYEILMEIDYKVFTTLKEVKRND